MDTFLEQLIKIRKDAKSKILYLAIWGLAILLNAFLFLFLPSGITIILIFGIFYGAFWLSSKLNVEFEYIITNGTLDIDKIINKSSRKRILSFELQGVTRLEKYNPNSLNGINTKEIVFAANPDDEGVYLMVANKKVGGSHYLVFSPDNRMIEAIKKFAPKFITNSAFN